MDEQTEISISECVERLIDQAINPDGRIDAPLWHDGSLYVTDSKILIEVDDYLKPGGAWEVSGGAFRPAVSSKKGVNRKDINPKAIAAILDQIGTCDQQMPAVMGPMYELDPFWQFIEDCDECSGRGWKTCSMGHRHDCGECDSEGKIATEHPSAMEPVTFCGMRIARRYVWIISQLPGVLAGKVDRSDGRDALGFKFQGGRGIVMAMVGNQQG
jgi:hypothetical protein